jgi:hypothetical protein
MARFIRTFETSGSMKMTPGSRRMPLLEFRNLALVEISADAGEKAERGERHKLWPFDALRWLRAIFRRGRKIGAANGTRTRDPKIHNLVL